MSRRRSWLRWGMRRRTSGAAVTVGIPTQRNAPTGQPKRRAVSPDDVVRRSIGARWT